MTWINVHSHIVQHFKEQSLFLRRVVRILAMHRVLRLCRNVQVRRLVDRARLDGFRKCLQVSCKEKGLFVVKGDAGRSTAFCCEEMKRDNIRGRASLSHSHHFINCLSVTQTVIFRDNPPKTFQDK